jgi:ATP-dependent RNA helicase DeaD
MQGIDMFAQAQTGTGKTGAFGSIMLGMTKPGQKVPSALVLVPTRELAMQVAEELDKLSKYTFHKCVPIFGGVSIDNQIRILRKGTDAIVGTPGRVKDLINRRELDLTKISMVVLDEADRMLDMGFAKDLNYILSNIPKKRQTMMFSATMHEDIKALTLKHMVRPIDVLVSKDELTAGLTEQFYIVADKDSKRYELQRILDDGHPKAMVFCHTKRRVDQLTKKLDGSYKVAGIHGGKAQNKRTNVIKQFAEGKIDALIATDVAARGLDIFDVEYVINYDMPDSPETYVHRIGRTGRAGAAGIAVTFVTPEEMRDLRLIEKQIGKPITNLSAISKLELAASMKRDNVNIAESVSGYSAKSPAAPARSAPAVKARGAVRPVAASGPIGPSGDMACLEIGFGTADGIGKGEVCDFVTDGSDLVRNDLGKITIYEKKTVISMQKRKAEAAAKDLCGAEYDGRPLSVRVTNDR